MTGPRLTSIALGVSIVLATAASNIVFTQTRILIKHVDPVYPPEAIAAGVEGTVTLEITVGVDGHVNVGKIVRSIPLLDQAAVAAVRQWEYDPRALRGQSFTTILAVPFNLPAAARARIAAQRAEAVLQDPAYQQQLKELRERQAQLKGRGYVRRAPVTAESLCGPASTAPPRLLAASDSAGLKAASCMPVTVTGTVTRVDRQPSLPHSAIMMTRLYFAPDIFVHIEPELDAAVQARLGIQEFGVWRLRNQKITVHVNPLFIQPKGGPVKLLLTRAEDISLTSGQLAPAPTVLVSEDFMAEGVANSRLFTNLFTGNFTAIDLNPNTQTFLLIMNTYLSQYAQLCARYLPANKVEIMSKECDTERVTRNGFGTVVSRVCVKYTPVSTAPTGLFADPALYNARVSVERRLAAGPANGDIAAGANGDMGLIPLAAFKEVIDEDMSGLLKMNGCNSPALKRFQENLRLFALGRQPILLGH